MAKDKIKKKKKFRIIKIIPFLIIPIVLLGIGFCIYCVAPVSKESEKVIFTIEKGNGASTIISNLYKDGLIKNELFAKVYYKINYVMNKEQDNNSIKHGSFILNKNMSLREIFNKITDSKGAKEDTFVMTFKEGKNMRGIVDVITSTTNITENDIYNTLSDKEYIKSLMEEYWFLGDEILSNDIYYPLEGYLAPNTYEFRKNSTIKDIFKVLLDQEERILDKYKTEIDKSNLNTHQIITLASIAELEGKTLEDRKNVIGVFMNRIKNNIPLGSDVTTYYASKVDMGERDLYQAEIDSNNPYNTRPMSSAGKLPVGPICNPSDESINAVLNYTPNEYFYFVADKNGKLYFTKTEGEHTAIIQKLKNQGLWFEY